MLFTMAAPMDFQNLLYREVIEEERGGFPTSQSPQTSRSTQSYRPRLLKIITGAETSQRDNKFSEHAGGFQYSASDCLDSKCRNRSIYWWTSDNQLTLREESLDYNLSSSHVVLSFSSSSLIGCGSVSVYEVNDEVYILVVTSNSVHRLIFPHPDRIPEEIGSNHEITLSSIFTEGALARCKDPANIYKFEDAGAALTSGSAPIDVQSCAAVVTSSKEAMFVLSANNSASLFVISMPPYGQASGVTVRELRPPIMSRLWSGLPLLGKSNSDGYGALSMCLVSDPAIKSAWMIVSCRDSKIRVWSTVTATELVCTVDPLENVGVAMNERENLVCQIVVKSSGEHMAKDGALVAVHLSFNNGQMISLYRLIMNGSVDLIHMLNINISDDLVDFKLTDQYLWTLSAGSAGEAVVKYMSLTSAASTLSWLHVLPAITPDAEVDAGRFQDSREAYMDYVFYPGRFSHDVISKALNIYRRIPVDALQPNKEMTAEALKIEVSDAVDTEVRRSAGDFEMDEIELVQLISRQWARFYTCVLQYHQRGAKLQGFHVDKTTGFVSMIRKGGTLSYVRPCEAIEHLYHVQSNESLNLESCVAGLFKDISSGRYAKLLTYLTLSILETGIWRDTIKTFRRIGEGEMDELVELCGYVQSVDELMGAEESYCYDSNLFHGGNPTEITQQLIQIFSESNRTGLRMIEQLAGRAVSYSDRFYETVESFIQFLNAGIEEDLNEPDDMEQNDEDNLEDSRLSVTRLFSSRSGVSLLCQSVRQIIRARFNFCRNLHIVLSVFRTANRSTLCARLLDQVSVLIQSYYLLKFCAETVVNPVSLAIDIDLNKRLLELLRTPSGSPASIALINDREVDHTLLEVFVRMREIVGEVKGSVLLRSGALISSQHEATRVEWRQALLTACNSVIHTLWPASIRLQLPLALISLCQYNTLQQYNRLSAWCSLNQCSRTFLQGLAYLHSNENRKACRSFVEASAGVLGDNLLLTIAHTEELDFIETVYYLRVIQLFEQLEVSDIVVSLAKDALEQAQHIQDHPHRSLLWSKIFKHELQMSHNSEAYRAILSNPDSLRRRDCLRQYIVVLWERGELCDIVNQSYRSGPINMEPDVIEILESRARSVDIAKAGYYELLYAFFIHRGNYRKAANVMYEQAARLSAEPVGVTGLRRQAKSYLCCMNALQLLSPGDAWVTYGDELETSGERTDNKKIPESTGLYQWKAPIAGLKKNQVQVMDLPAVCKAYTLLHAQLTLLEQSGAAVVSLLQQRSLRADEVVGQLVTAGLFDLAFHISLTFSLQLNSVFEGLTLKCLQLVECGTSQVAVDNDNTLQAWKWLKLNNLPASNNAATTQSITATDQAWLLLSSYLDRYGDRTTRYHRCVTTKILHHGLIVPSWLVSSYKKLNPAELLRLYLDHDRVEEASSLTIEYLQALLGPKKEKFDLQDFLHDGAKPLWMPYAALDQLISALQSGGGDSKYSKILSELHHELNGYLKKAESISRDTMQHYNTSYTRR